MDNRYRFLGSQDMTSFYSSSDGLHFGVFDDVVAPPPPNSEDPPIISQMLSVYEAEIDKQLESSKTWFVEWDMTQTLFQKENMSLEYVEFRGRSSCRKEIRATVGYRCNNSFKTSVFKKTFDGLREAFVWVWTFMDKYTLCKECGGLLESEKECDACFFFRGYMAWIKRQEICAICQDPVYRFCLPCGHMFHRLCMNKIEFSETIRCPLCRVEIPYDVICDIFDKPRRSNDIVLCEEESDVDSDHDSDEETTAQEEYENNHAENATH